ncbi:hypothetical protein EH240_27230 [Mesorhizobium tamadayense]|uniref:Propionyl-coenzyme A carboxylase alpha polypeptide n=1 Tax=Mesorhizobium tamadayense TaxID=425306 RepID=A0A3P3F6Z2_9HYPH|nr:hypothetical protein EH240_27230 [Mesorhizobium tamadayense]
MITVDHPPLACRPSPPQGGRSAVSPPRSFLSQWRLAKAAERLISPLAGEMAGRPEGGGRELGIRQPFETHCCIE